LEGDHTQESVGDLMDEIGFTEAGRIIGEIGRAAFPSDEPEDGAAEQGNGKAGKKAR